MQPDSNSASQVLSDFNAPAWRYSGTAIFLHWTLAVWLTAMAGLGWYMMSIEDEPGSGWYFALHKSFGILALLLLAARVVWRITHRPSALPAADAAGRWVNRVAHVTQALLYLLMALMPLTGYLGAAYTKSGVQLFGLPLPQWAVPDHDQAEQFFEIHSVLVWVLVALVALHVLGALKHLLLDKNGVFARMWFKPSR